MHLKHLLQSCELLDNYTVVKFAKTVPMSTYLVCFLISDFKFTSKPVHAEFGEDFTIRVYASPHQLDKTEFAAATATAVTEFYINYYKVEYPLTKLGKYCCKWNWFYLLYVSCRYGCHTRFFTERHGTLGLGNLS